MIPNVIKIEKNIPIPDSLWTGRESKYAFIRELDIGDSFVINGNTPDYSPKSAMNVSYGIAHSMRKKGGIGSNFRVACRVLKKMSGNVESVRIWRTS